MIHILEALRLSKNVMDLHGTTPQEATTDMALQARHALANEATQLCADCPETIRLKTADPAHGDAYKYHNWQVISHDGRLSAGQQGRIIPGVMLHRNNLENMTLGSNRLGELLTRIARFWGFDELEVDKYAVRT